MLKRIIDIITSLFFLIILFPFIPIYIILIWIIYQKSILLKIPTIGKNGKLFKLYRFYSPDSTWPCQVIRFNPENSSSPLWIDKFLSFTRLSSWPMLFNVLKGNLSLVGPVPEPPEVVQCYSENQRQILNVRPGILGRHYFYFKQQGHDGTMNSDLSQTEKYIKYILPNKLSKELRYVEDHRIGKDVRILIKSIISIFRNIIIQNLKTDLHTYNFLIVIDLFLIFLSYFLAYHLRFEWQLSLNEYRIFFMTLPIVLTIRIFIYDKFGLYKNIWKYIGVPDLLKIIWSTTVSSVLIASFLFFIGLTGHSRAVFIIDWIFCISLIGGSRLLLRLSSENIDLENKLRKNLLIIGAGDVGDMLLREIEKSTRNECNVIGFIDDNKEKDRKSVA